MNERRVTMQAIRNLTQVCEALNFHVMADHAPQNVVQVAMKCADHAEHIAADDIEGFALPARMQGILNSMQFLKIARQGFDAVFARQALYVPTIAEIEAVAIEAMALCST